MKKLLGILMLCSFAVFAESVNINQADAESISRALKGIGPKKAEAIVQYRKEHGNFKTPKDLENVKGIGVKTIQLNEKDIVYDDGGVSGVAVDKAVAEKKTEKPIADKKAN